jgi:hypothetical protein
VNSAVNPYYGWQRPYLAAVLETDRSMLLPRLQEADDLIQARIHELDRDHLATHQERAAIEFALNCLKVLRREVAPAQNL